jgi:hypothetical protein
MGSANLNEFKEAPPSPLSLNLSMNPPMFPMQHQQQQQQQRHPSHMLQPPFGLRAHASSPMGPPRPFGGLTLDALRGDSPFSTTDMSVDDDNSSSSGIWLGTNPLEEQPAAGNVVKTLCIELIIQVILSYLNGFRLRWC